MEGYKPTPAEEKILEVLLDPANIGKSVTEKCELAGVSRQVYYKAMEKAEFKELTQNMSIDLIKGNVVDLVNAAVKHAKDGSHAHFKTLMEMAGMHIDKIKQEVDLTYKNQNLTDKEMSERAARLICDLIKSGDTDFIFPVIQALEEAGYKIIEGEGEDG